jgi:cytochrome c-type biogenesis protein CcmE
MKKLIIVSAVFAGALAVLVWVGIVEASIPVLRPSQLLSGEYQGGTVQIDGGKVASVESLTPLRFEIQPDGDDATRVRVRSARLAPENFKVGVKVSLRGEYDATSGVFEAYKISTQCPSRYEAAKEAPSSGQPPKPPPKPAAPAPPVSPTVN